jgi:hypothetical protein
VVVWWCGGVVVWSCGAGVAWWCGVTWWLCDDLVNSVSVVPVVWWCCRRSQFSLRQKWIVSGTQFPRGRKKAPTVSYVWLSITRTREALLFFCASHFKTFWECDEKRIISESATKNESFLISYSIVWWT